MPDLDQNLAAEAAGPREPRAIDLVEQLDCALHGDTWARPYSPARVWAHLLDEVRKLVAGRDEVQRHVARLASIDFLDDRADQLHRPVRRE